MDYVIDSTMDSTMGCAINCTLDFEMYRAWDCAIEYCFLLSMGFADK